MDTQILDFLNEQFPKTETKVIPLAGDASSRKYFRIIENDTSYVLMYWEPFDRHHYPFLSVLEHFQKNQVAVPKVIGLSEKLGMVLLEDLGDLTLERKVWENQNQELALPYYERALDELIKMNFDSTKNKAPCTAFELMFDTEKFLWEMKYGLDNLILGVCRHELTEPAKKEILSVFQLICETLHQEPKWIAHRDYHSRNLMIKLDQIRVIDFQDARLGPLQYDLVSLLRDSYVNLSDQSAHHLLDYYLDQAKPHLPADFSRSHFDWIYELQTVQRCFKACGSFASFYNQRKDTRYLKYISPTLRRVLKSLNEFPEYKLFADLLIDSGALERKYEIL